MSEAPAKRKTAISKLIHTALHARTPGPEAMAAFIMLRKLLAKAQIDATEIIRPEWGGGPLQAALNKHGTVVMITGKHMGCTLQQIADEDPNWIVAAVTAGGLAPGPRDVALRAVYKGLTEEMFCRISGEWRGWNMDTWTETEATPPVPAKQDDDTISARAAQQARMNNRTQPV